MIWAVIHVFMSSAVAIIRSLKSFQLTVHIEHPWHVICHLDRIVADLNMVSTMNILLSWLFEYEYIRWLAMWICQSVVTVITIVITIVIVVVSITTIIIETSGWTGVPISFYILESHAYQWPIGSAKASLQHDPSASTGRCDPWASCRFTLKNPIRGLCAFSTPGHFKPFTVNYTSSAMDSFYDKVSRTFADPKHCPYTSAHDHSDHSCVWIVSPSFLNVFHIFFRICTPTLRPHPLSFSLNGHFSPWFTPGLRLLKKGIHSLLALLADASSLALEPERRGEAVEERWGGKTKRFNGIG